MPHDTMPPDLSIDPAAEIFPELTPQEPSGILALMKQAGRSLVASAKIGRRKVILASMMAASLALCTPPATYAQARNGYIAGGGVFQVFDTSSNQITQTLNALGAYDYGLGVSPNGQSVYVSNYQDANDLLGAAISIYDAQTQTFGMSIPFTTAQPGYLKVDPGGQYLYVATNPPGQFTTTGIAVVSTTSNSIVRTLNLPFPALNIRGLSITPDARYAYEISATDQTQLAKVDMSTGQVLSTFSLGYTYVDDQGMHHNVTWKASGMEFTSDGTKAYVQGDGFSGGDPVTALVAMSTSSNSVVTNMEVSPILRQQNDFAGALVCGSLTKCYVVDKFNGSLAFAIDTNTNTFGASISAGLVVQGGAFTPDGRFLYLAPFESAMRVIDTATDQVIALIQNAEFQTVLSIAPAPLAASGKSLGSACDISNGCAAGDPITIGTGNVFEQIDDYRSSGQNPISFTRYYNSLGNIAYNSTFATTLGMNWRSNYDRYLHIAPPTGQATSVAAERADGQVLTFTWNGNSWTTDTDVDVSLSQAGSTWTLTDHNDIVETYSADSSGKGTLSSIKLRNGYTQNLTYVGGLLQSVTDSYNRSLQFTYSNGLLQSVTTPDTVALSYGFTSVIGGNQLTSVSYNNGTSQTYLYENASFRFALTGVVDEKGQRFSTWEYDEQGRATSSQLGSNANLTSLTYNSDGTTTVTNALGVADTYTFATLQGVPKVTEISRAATSTTAAATESFAYDTNGYVNSLTDWNGTQTTLTNNSHGEPTAINYALGTPQAYSVNITYDSTWVHLPQQIVTPGLTSVFTYDGTGNPHTRTDTDTTNNIQPYNTNGQQRTTTWTWSSTGELQSAQLPRTDVVAKTQFGYDSTGALTGITDALGHITQITSHTGGGLPLTVIDPNHITTTLTYDGRLNLNTSTVHSGSSNLTTTWTWDAANSLQSVQKPDGSMLTYGYDTAHRLTDITDLFGNNAHFTLNALGNATAISITNAGHTQTWAHSAVFDALGRVLQDIGGMGQTTATTWDPNGNPLTATPPAPSGAVTYTWDALNRLATAADPAPGGTTTYTYDEHNRVLNVKDANNHTTSYVYDGFGDRIQTASPDSGTTVNYYDPDRNLTQRILPGNLVMNATYDALDRVLATTYPADNTLNISRTYDQGTIHGFGIGHLTSATDQAGSLSLSYDPRGNVMVEGRVIAGVGTLNTSMTFDAADNIASINYPSGTVVAYARDAMGRVTAVTAHSPLSPVFKNVATDITYEPFGPVTGLTFGNGITGAYGFDLDYRATTRVDSAPANILNLTYGYYTNNSVQTITDAVNGANSQSMTYDPLDRLLSATSGGGGYGAYSYTWDPAGNIQTQTINGAQTTYGYTSGTNQLSQWVTGGTTETVTSTPTGNINTLAIGGITQETLTYNQANRLANATTLSSAASYQYAFDGNRLVKSPATGYPILYQFNRVSGELLSENDQHRGTVADYIYLNSRPIGEVNPINGKFYFTHTDRLGTPDTLTDSTKAVAWNALYTAFGDTGSTVTGSLATQSLRLPGQTFDPETGYNHNGFRDYAATITRYVESDPIGIGLVAGKNPMEVTPYQYVMENPAKYVDKNGLNTTLSSGSSDGSSGETILGKYYTGFGPFFDWMNYLYRGGTPDRELLNSIASVFGDDSDKHLGEAMTSVVDTIFDSLPRGCPTAYDKGYLPNQSPKKPSPR